MNIFSKDKVKKADLIVDAIYEGSERGELKNEPISTLLGVGNSGGFRPKKFAKKSGAESNYSHVGLFTTLDDIDWPDSLDVATGSFVYYGDNKTPGKEIHSAPGNKLLRQTFSLIHNSETRASVPPFFIFQRFRTDKSARAVQFKGLAIPGGNGLSETNDLVAVWRSSGKQRFQNYLANFTILDEAKISREWIDSLIAGKPNASVEPRNFRLWKQSGTIRPLISPPTTVVRTLDQQTPKTARDSNILELIHKSFSKNPFEFEKFAAWLFQMHDSKVSIDEITRNTVDGGKDARGRYSLGLKSDPIYLDFALEAKCYSPKKSVGVKETSRLISRIKHRQFGVLVTTSAVARQAYSEIREDQHPILIISGADIVEILKDKGMSTVTDVRRLIENKNYLMT